MPSDAAIKLARTFVERSGNPNLYVDESGNGPIINTRSHEVEVEGKKIKIHVGPKNG